MPTHFRGPARVVRALNAYITLVRASESVTARLLPRLERAGLSASQFGALEALYHLGPLCQADLGRKLLKTGGNVTMVVRNLERRGLVRRERGRDRRFNTVHLTPAGRRIIARVFPGHAAAIAREMAVLVPREQEHLRRLCRMLGLKRRKE